MSELAQRPRTQPGIPIIGLIIGVAVAALVVWYLHAQERTAGEGSGHVAAATDGASRGSSGGRGGAGSGARVVPVQVAVAERKDLPIWLEGLGTVAAVQQVTVRPQVDGRLDKVLFTEGKPVKRGDVLAQIDPRPFLVTLHNAQGALERDRAQLVMNQVNLKRYADLKAQDLVAGQQVEQIEGAVGQFSGAVKIDQSQIENAQLQLDYAQVKAPLDGIAGIRQVDAGNLVHQTDPGGLVVITALDPAAVFFTVPQDQLTRVAEAQVRGDVPVEVYSRDGATKLATGKLAVLDNQVNQATSTLRLKALVDNAKHVLWPNAFVKAQMLVELRKNAVVIPAVAVQRGPQGTFVYQVGADKTAQMKPVTIALTTGDNAVIAKGLEGGEQVIIEGQNQVRPGGPVAPTNLGGKGGPDGGGKAGKGGPVAGQTRAHGSATAAAGPQ